MTQTRIRTADLPLRRLLVPTTALTLGAALVLGAAASARAQDDGTEAAAGIDGTWVVDTSIGSYDDFSNSWAGFRVAEVLDPGGENVAVGRTPDVSGQLEASGSVIEEFAIEVDLTSLTTDNNFRNGAIQRSLGTDQHPTATFVSTEPVDLGAVPSDGDTFDISVPGTLTIRDMSEDVVVEMQGGRGGESVAVVGTWPIEFGTFGVSMPSAPIVASVSENGDLEWQLFFRRDS